MQKLLPKKLTSTFVKELKPAEKDYVIWDTEIKGFQCKVTPKGRRVFLYSYYTKNFEQRRPAIGVFDSMTCDQARLIAKQWQVEVAMGGDPSKNKTDRRKMITMKELSEKYMNEHANCNKKPKSIKNDELMWRCHILPRIGRRKVSGITRTDISELHNALFPTPTTANRCLSLLSTAFNLSEKWGYREDHTNPCKHIKKYTEKKRERYLSNEEINRLNSVIDKCLQSKTIMPSAAVAIRLLLIIGARLSEILTMKWKYVDLENGLLKLPDSKTGAKFIQLPSDAIAMLKDLFEDPQRCATNPYVVVGQEKDAHLPCAIILI